MGAQIYTCKNKSNNQRIKTKSQVTQTDRDLINDANSQREQEQAVLDTSKQQNANSIVYIDLLKKSNETNAQLETNTQTFPYCQSNVIKTWKNEESNTPKLNHDFLVSKKKFSDQTKTLNTNFLESGVAQKK